MLIYLLQLAGTAACASSGALSAGRKSLDLIGVMVVSFAAAVGGGTLRDVLLDRNPVFWLAAVKWGWRLPVFEFNEKSGGN